MTVASNITAFIKNTQIIQTEGLLLRFLRVIEKFVEFSLCRDTLVTECCFPHFHSHYQSRVSHQAVYVQEGTFRRRRTMIQAWWPRLYYDDAAQDCEIRCNTGQVNAKDEDSSLDSRRVQPRVGRRSSYGSNIHFSTSRGRTRGNHS